MIAFGCSLTDAEVYRRHAQPGVELAREADSAILAMCGVHPAARALNLVLDAAAELEELEALVLLAPYVEITDPELTTKVRRLLADPQVGMLGIAGAKSAQSIAWWEGETVVARVRHAYQELGGGEVAGFPWVDGAPAPGEVETLDGQLLVLSPDVVRRVRFDEALHLGTGIDFDFCRQVRSAGWRLMVAELGATIHAPLELVGNLELWTEGHVQVAEKWTEAVTGTDGEEAWKRRARRAEAEREAARAFAFSRSLELDARVLDLERELARKTHTRSWRLTRPLRDVNHWRRERFSARDSAVRSV